MARVSPKLDLCVVGGAGHVGLPLALVFASRGLRVCILDLNRKALETLRQGRLPFLEKGAQPLLAQALRAGRLTLSDRPEAVSGARTVVVCVGTPVDEFLSPSMRVIRTCVDGLLPHLSDGQLVVLRSTVYPGTTAWLAQHLLRKGKRLRVAFCPERVVQGFAVGEVQRLPQIVSGTTPGAEAAAERLFARVAPEVIRLSTKEAEFAKLFSNAYRYIQFAATNQFYMIADAAGVDYHRVLEGMKRHYPRLADLPGPGLSAGPCLLKDTMQLATFADNNFSIGHAAMLVNEGVVLHILAALERKHRLAGMTVGLLGLAFKADCDDTRSSLSYKFKKILSFKAKRVLTTDPHVTTDPDNRPLKEVLKQSDLLILCVPHKAYRNLDLKGKPVADLWGFLA